MSKNLILLTEIFKGIYFWLPDMEYFEFVQLPDINEGKIISSINKQIITWMKINKVMLSVQVKNKGASNKLVFAYV